MARSFSPISPAFASPVSFHRHPLTETSLFAVVVEKKDGVEIDFDKEEEISTANRSLDKVAVTGATGRTGILVVEELLSRGINVVGIVRNMDKAQKTFSRWMEEEVKDQNSPKLTLLKCDLGSESDLITASEGCDAAVWCATGFSDAPNVSFVQKATSLLRIVLSNASFANTIDSVGISALAKAFKSVNSEVQNNPKVVMLSSAGVTRPSWDDDKKEKFSGSSDIPIVRLNPFNILDIKADSEEKLRQSGVDYCIFRPTGLNDKWPSNSRPIFSQGDVGVGRISRQDVAKILVDCLTIPEANGKTFEAFTLQGYEPPPSINTALGRLRLDKEGLPSNEVLFATYTAMQQLLPGEKQDSAALAMGQTYEEFDEGRTGRLGDRGTEDAEGVAPNPTS